MATEVVMLLARVRKGIQSEAERCRQVHFLCISHPLQEKEHQPQGTSTIRSHMIRITAVKAIIILLI